MNNSKARMLAAALMSSASIPGTEFRMPRIGGSRDIGRTGLRQGARLERQMAKGMLDFSASERCLARINARTTEGTV